MIRSDWETKINGTVSVGQAHCHRVLVYNLLRVDPPGLVDLFEQEKSRVFRFPAKQQNHQHWRLMEKNANGLMPKCLKVNLIVVQQYKKSCIMYLIL